MTNKKNTVKRELMNIEVLNLVRWYKGFSETPCEDGKTKLKHLDVKRQWNLVNNIKKLLDDNQKFEDFRDGLIHELQNEYFNEEKSFENERVQVDELGNDIIDADGNPVMEMIRTVKDEYMEEYRNRVAELNVSIQDLAAEKNEYTFADINIDELVESLDAGSPIELEDLTMLSAFSEDTSVTDETKDESDK